MDFSFFSWRLGAAVSLAVLFLAMQARALAADPLGATYREVRVHVVDDRGAARRGVTVYLAGMERDAPHSPNWLGEESADLDVGRWKCVTDARGNGVFRLGCFPRYEKDRVSGGPGWGFYYLVASTAHERGVSVAIDHVEKGGYAANMGGDEWTRRGVVRTTDRPLRVTLRLRRGIVVTGRVVDAHGRAVAGCPVEVFHDLHADTHTGYGGEIFHLEQTTDARGWFRIEQVYPNTFYAECGSPNEEESPTGYWYRTKAHGRWLAEPVYGFTPRAGEKEVRIDFGVSRTLPFRYHGRVTDPEGKPIAGATVGISTSNHSRTQTFDDDHHAREVTTDAEGRYELMSNAGFLVWVQVTAAGYSPGGRSSDERGRLPRAGEVDVVLQPVGGS